MKRSAVAFVLGIIALAELAYLSGSHAYALAVMPDPIPTPTPEPSVEIVETAAPSATPALTPTMRPATPEPTPTPKWAPVAEYDQGEFRCLARYKHSTLPSNATMITQIVALEVPQNRTINTGFPNTVRYVLLSGDFGGYDPESKYYKSDRTIADFVMRSWAAAQSGDSSYRYTPWTGIYLSYSKDGRYCKVYDKNWRVVCDTRQFE